MTDKEKDVLTSKLIKSLARANGGSLTISVGAPGKPVVISTAKGYSSGPSMHAAAKDAAEKFTAPAPNAKSVERLGELLDSCE